MGEDMDINIDTSDFLALDMTAPLEDSQPREER